MFNKGNEMHLGKLLISISFRLAAWIAGFAVLACFGIYALFSVLGAA